MLIKAVCIYEKRVKQKEEEEGERGKKENSSSQSRRFTRIGRVRDGAVHEVANEWEEITAHCECDQPWAERHKNAHSHHTTSLVPLPTSTLNTNNTG